MNELEIQISKQGEISFNLESLKKELSEIADRYEGIVVSEESIPLAKKDLAELRKTAKEIEDRRKAIKKEWSKPYDAFEKEVKVALEIINKPISDIDKQIKEYESQAKAEKEQHCRELFDANVGEYAEYIEFGDVFKDAWINKSATDTEILSDISGARLKVKTDIEAIKSLGSEFETEIIDEYKKTKELSAAIQRNTQLVSAKQLAEKKAEEEAQAKIEAERRAKEEAERKAAEAEKRAEEAEKKAEEPVVLPFDEEPKKDYAVFTVRVQDEEQYEQVKQFCEFSEIQYSVVR